MTPRLAVFKFGVTYTVLAAASPDAQLELMLDPPIVCPFLSGIDIGRTKGLQRPLPGLLAQKPSSPAGKDFAIGPINSIYVIKCQQLLTPSTRASDVDVPNQRSSCHKSNAVTMIPRVRILFPPPESTKRSFRAFFCFLEGDED